MPDLRGLLADPEFNALPINRRTAILGRIHPQLANDYAASKGGINFPGKESSVSQGQPQGALSSAWDAIRESIFGHEDRAEAEAAGVYQQPTTAGMLRAAAFEAGPMIGPPTAGGVQRAAGAVGSRIPGAVGAAVTRAGQIAADHPRIVNAALGAATGGALGEDPKIALAGAILGSRLGSGRGVHAPEAPVPAPRPQAPPAAPAAAPRGLPGGYVAPRKVTAAPPPAAPAPAPKATQAELDAFAREISAPPPPGNRAAKAPARKPPAPKASEPAPADPGRARAQAHAELAAFARQIAQENPKVGKKIWILMKDGKPVRALTSDQAGAVTRAKRPGETATWFRNLWGRAADTFAEVN